MVRKRPAVASSIAGPRSKQVDQQPTATTPTTIRLIKSRVMLPKGALSLLKQTRLIFPLPRCATLGEKKEAQTSGISLQSGDNTTRSTHALSSEANQSGSQRSKFRRAAPLPTHLYPTKYYSAPSFPPQNPPRGPHRDAKCGWFRMVANPAKSQKCPSPNDGNGRPRHLRSPSDSHPRKKTRRPSSFSSLELLSHTG